MKINLLAQRYSPQKNLSKMVLSLGLLLGSSVVPGVSRAISELANGENDMRLSETALEEYESGLQAYFKFLEQNSLYRVQQYDTAATEVSVDNETDRYMSAVKDPFYGYKMFILVDKSKSSGPSKLRDGKTRQAQTMYIYQRDSANKLSLVYVTPVSTGKELTPGVSDTREGYTRVQNAQQTYVSRKYGEAMPNSLWFESEYGTAIHQTTQARCDSLMGQRASAGCIRLCPGTSTTVFNLVTAYSRNQAIVLLDKRSGTPIQSGTGANLVRMSGGVPMTRPKVIAGYPVFVRIIDVTTPAKEAEAEMILDNPTEGFKRYFPKVGSEVLQGSSI